MARRPLAGRDQKIIQGHRRDEFFARMRRKGGVARLPTQGAFKEELVADEPEAAPVEAEAQPAETAEPESEPATNP
jgi:hypothetical protein